MKRILIPLDGSEFAERALEPGARLASRLGGELHLASVVSDLPPVPLAAGDGDLVSRWFEEEESRANKYLDAVAERSREDFPALTVRTHVRLGPVARTLESLAEEVGAEVLALTTHGRGTWQRAWLGSVADQLLRQSRRPVLLLRDGDAGRALFSTDASPAHVLVPLDGSDAARAVLEPLDQLFEGGRKGKVSLVSVLQQPFPLATSYLPHAVAEDRLMDERKARIGEHLNEVEAGLVRKGYSVESHVLVAEDAAQGLLDFAKKHGVEMVAISTRGRGGVSRLFLGSVADKVVRGAQVPILIARRPPSEDEG